MNSKYILKKHYGYESFRNGQEELVNSILDGKDTLGIMPTGAGKSVCFQVPACLLEGITLVVSPLISLMKDQVDALTQNGINACFINSSLTSAEISNILYVAENGAYTLIYIAPERLLAPNFLAFAQRTNISMITIDEAHCISQWGQDFRPSYTDIPKFIDTLPKRPIISAFTATATSKVKDDIISLLSLKNPFTLTTGFDRKNLHFSVENPKSKMASLLKFLEQNDKAFGIVYCSTRKAVEEVAEKLSDKGYDALPYHAGLTDNQRKFNQNAFLFDKANIIVATNAFGMGIDKSNVSFVVHYNMPKDLESYYQEAGRAGRDGSPATCLLLYSGQDVVTNQWLIDNRQSPLELDKVSEKELKKREYDRLKMMTFYSTTKDCLRGFILKYFGEKPKPHCGHCSNCDSLFEKRDITIEAQKILSCVYRMKQNFGVNMVIDVLTGAQNQNITKHALHELSTYNISDKKPSELREIINFLLEKEYLKLQGEPYALLCLTNKSREILFEKQHISMKFLKEKTETKTVSTIIGDSIPKDHRPLFEKLKMLRLQFAAKQSIPAFTVFSDKSLIEMCVHLPCTIEDFLKITGVGEQKASKYGQSFTSAINGFCKEKKLGKFFKNE